MHLNIIQSSSHDLFLRTIVSEREDAIPSSVFVQTDIELILEGMD